MNVSQENSQSSQLRKELRERKIMTNIEAAEQVKPFRSFRKGNNVVDGQLQDNDVCQAGQSKKGSPAKLKYQYPTYDTNENQADKSPRRSKYRYDIGAKFNQTNFAGKYLTRSAHEDQNDPIKEGQSDPVKQSVAQSLIRKNMKKLEVQIGFGNSPRRIQVQSIIFDSKVSKRSKYDGLEDKYVRHFSVSEELPSDKKLLTFQNKVNQVNSEIEAGLSNLERMIDQLKKKRVENSQVQFKIKAQERVKNLEKQFADRRAVTQKQREEDQEKRRVERQRNSPKKEAQPVKEEVNTDLVEKVLQKQKILQERIEKAVSPEKVKEEDVTQSLIQLEGDFKNKGQQFPPEYTSFINRLSMQIQKDIEFTSKINDLTKSNHIESVKSLIFNQIEKRGPSELSLDESFFKIEPMQVDPLDQAKPAWYKKFSEEQLQNEALNVFKYYENIETHFTNKLQHKYSPQIIKLLFEELAKFNFTSNSISDNSSVTVGHLLSYLNMRTNKSFRNRSFIKILKRFNLSHNAYLNAEALSRLVKK